MYGVLWNTVPELYLKNKRMERLVLRLFVLQLLIQKKRYVVWLTRGKAVLAHPGQYDNFSELPCLVEAGLWGIEAYHPKHSDQHTARCFVLAETYGLAVTGGSDFHGRYGEGEELGQCGVMYVPF